ncbi:MAG: glycoside hydrolase family 3 protein [bacterium]|nr:glycoside hydrolase family 3 protein [bacterium]
MRFAKFVGVILVGFVVLMIGCGVSEHSGPGVDVVRDGSVHPGLWPEMEPAVALDSAIEQAIDELLAEMRDEDKVGQVIQAELRYVTPEDVRKYRLGSVLNGGGSHPGDVKNTSPREWVDLADAFYDASMDTSEGGVAIPVVWGTDAVHGHTNVIGATVFPHNIGLGATNNPVLMRRIGEVTATEVAVTGLDWDFGPTLAVVRNDRWGRTYEGYSEDPDIVRAYAGEMVRGLQGDLGTEDFLDQHHVIATAKHFLGDGGTEGGKDQGDNLGSETELRDIHGAGYQTALEAGVQTVMASFSRWQGRKMHGNQDLLTDVLKGQMGFNGFVVGDWNAHGQVDGCANDSCPAAFNAGIDMFMVPEDWKGLYHNTLAQVRSGEISAERLDDAVRRILRVKKRAGLFEAGRPSERPLAGRADLFGSPEHRAVARQAVRESMVLLKNSDQLLPLRRDLNVLVAGDGADNIGKQSGGWTITWQGTGNANEDFPGGTSIWDGISDAVTSGGGKAVFSEDGSYNRRPDVAIVVFGEDPYAEFQGDLETLEYRFGKERDLALLRNLHADDVPVVSVFLTGRPMWVNPELNASDAFVVAWLPGSEGVGVSDVIFRDNEGAVAHDFVGKLSYSWPHSISQVELNRHEDGYDPLFAYGFGLSSSDSGDLAALSEETGEAAPPTSRTVYFAGGPVAPWQLFVADGVNPPVLAAAATASTADGEDVVIRSVDRLVQEDARLVKWAGLSRGSVAIYASEPVDLTRESNGELALAVDLFVDEAPSAPVFMKMSCDSECESELDISEALSGFEPGQWHTLRISLRCFADAGADMRYITTPFEIVTEGTMTLRFAEVRLVPANDGKAICPGN